MGGGGSVGITVVARKGHGQILTKNSHGAVSVQQVVHLAEIKLALLVNVFACICHLIKHQQSRLPTARLQVPPPTPQKPPPLVPGAAATCPSHLADVKLALLVKRLRQFLPPVKHQQQRLSAARLPLLQRPVCGVTTQAAVPPSRRPTAATAGCPSTTAAAAGHRLPDHARCRCRPWRGVFSCCAPGQV
jgi:hypothetical protein